MSNSQKVAVLVTSAIAWGGKVRPANTEMVLHEKDARRLLERGKVKLGGPVEDDEDGQEQEDEPKAQAKRGAVKATTKGKAATNDGDAGGGTADS